MARKLTPAGDSPRSQGGAIPGSGGDPAFVASGPEPSAIPVLIAVPHAGRAYTAALLDRMRAPADAALRLEDRHVDRLARRVAEATGAMLLVAQAPRAMIDLNRAPDDIDWEMLGDPARADPASHAPSRRARTGLGLVPRRLPGLGELWKRRLEAADLDARIAGIHAPYHACLGELLARLRRRWGAALLIDLHSMPSLAAAMRGEPPEYVVGDRFGASCDGSLVAACFGFLAQAGHRVAHNRPYAGGYVLERHADPRAGIHALQLEVDRAAYLDSRSAEEGSGFVTVAATLAGLVKRLAALTAALATRDGSAEGWAEAAE